MNKGFVSIFIGLLMGCLLMTSQAFGGREPIKAPDPLGVIKRAQKNLQKLRYYTLTADGIIGAETRKAIMLYQYEMDLPMTGALDNSTLKHLNRPSVIFNTQNFAPFHYPTARKGQADGPMPQIVRMACRKAGINCRIILYDDWNAAQQDVKNGKAEGLFMIAWNSERAKWLHRSTAIIETEYGLFVRDNDTLNFNEVLQNSAILEGYTVGVYGPSGTSTSLRKLKTAIESRGVKININMVPDDKQIFKTLSLSNKKYAVYSNRIVGESINKGLGLSNIRYAGKHRGLSYYVGFSKQRVPLPLVEKFSQAYLSLVNQGDVISIMANHSMPIPKNIKMAAAESTGHKPPQKTAPQRFRRQSVKGMSVVLDANTCLMWQQAGSVKFCNWREAQTYVDKLNREKHGGFSDWRLPTIDELTTLMEKDRQATNKMYINPIFEALQQTCWSNDKKDTGIEFVDFFDGALGSKDRGDTNFVRAVRTTKCSKS